MIPESTVCRQYRVCAVVHPVHVHAWGTDGRLGALYDNYLTRTMI